MAADGLALWLRADAGIATNAGDWVTQWADQSGRDNHGYQPNGTSAPLLVRDGPNGLPVLRFDGGDTVRFTTRLTTVRTVFWVVSTAEVPGGANANRSLLGDTLGVSVARGHRVAGDDLERVRVGRRCGTG